MKMKKKAIFFDFDYTLGDSTEGIVASVNFALKQLGYHEQETPAIKKTIGLSLEETYSTLTGKNSEKESLLFPRYFKEMADQVMVNHTELYDGIKESLAGLRNKGYRLGIVTTKFHYRIQQILEKYDADSLIDLIVGAEDVKKEKPSPEGLLWGIKCLGIERNDALYVGDSIVDARTARNAEVDFAGVLTGMTAKEEFQQYPHLFVMENVNQICQFI